MRETVTMGDVATENFANSEMFRALPRKRMGAGLVIVDDERRILLVEPIYKTQWELPGGMVETGESPRDAVSREVREEFGLDVTIGRLLVIDWVPPGVLPDDGVMLLYAAGPFDTSEIVLPPHELRSWEWCDQETVRTRVPDFMSRRVDAALEALTTDSVAELQNGYHVGSISS